VPDRASLPLDDPDRLAAVAAASPAPGESAARLERLVQRARITSDAEAVWLVLGEVDAQRVLAADGDAPAAGGARLPHADAPAVRTMRRGVAAFDRGDDARVALPVADRDGFTVGALVVSRSGRRPWQPEEAAALAGFADWAATELELARERRDRAGAEAASRDEVRTASDLVLDLDADGRLLDANPAARAVVGEAAAWVQQFVAPDHATAWAEAFLRAGATREGLDVEVVLVRPDGRRALVRGRLRARPSDAPHVTVRAVLRDVTTERRASDERERMLATLEATTDVVAVMDVHARLTWLNGAGRRLAGLSRDADVTGLPFTRLLAPGAWAALEREALPAAIAGGSWAGETLLQRADGVAVPASQVVVAHVTARGRVWFLSTILRDISDRRQVEDQLREREARFRRLADASRDGVLVVAEGAVSEANAAAERLLGAPRQGLVGQRITDLFHPEARARVEAALSRGLDGSIEVAGSGQGGAAAALEVTVAPVSIEGRPAQVVVLRDVSGARDLDRLGRDAVTTVSHEFRAPLSSVRAAIDRVATMPEVAVQRVAIDLLRAATDTLDRLGRLVGDLLDLERLQVGAAPLALASLAADDVVRAVADGLRPVAESLAVAIVADVPDDLRVVADRDRLLQVLTNLVSNALRFSPAGAAVTVRAARTGDAVRFEIEDRGPGIAPDELPRLFGRFVRLDNVALARTDAGAGLGLAISRSIVERHRGRIGATSRPGECTVFWFELPDLGGT